MNPTIDEDLDEVGNLHDALFNYVFEELREYFLRKIPGLSPEESAEKAEEILLTAGI